MIIGEQLIDNWIEIEISRCMFLNTGLIKYDVSYFEVA